mgnify:FL=1
MPKVSIIIPVYNAEKYIQTTVDSVLSQTFSDWELLLIDDCSKDHTSSICEKLVQSDNRITYIRQNENGGPAKARNVGVDYAKGEYLAFVDSDDTIETTFLEKLVTTAIYNHSDIVWCNYNEVLDNSKICKKHNLPCHTSIPYDTYIRFFFNNQEGLGSMWTKLYRKSFLEQNKLFLNPERVHGEDWEFNLNCFRCHPILVAIDDCLYNYIRQNNYSVIASYRTSDYQTFVKSNLMIEVLAQEENIEYDRVARIGNFIYLVIQLLILLKRSRISNKKSEFKRIVNDDYFRKSIKYQLARYLPIRYKLYFFLLKYRLIKIAYFVM